MKHPEAQFLHQQNPNLHHSAEVEAVADYLRQGGEHVPNNPAEKIAAHLGFLASTEHVNDGILTGDSASVDRQVSAHVMDAVDVPEAYFTLQQRIAREQGHGDIQITADMRRQLVEAVQADQRGSLSKWVEYIGAEGYPDWFKSYTFSAVTKMGNYDKEKGEFGKRSTGTTAPYPELNREALAYVFDAVQKNRIEGDQLDDRVNSEQLQKLLKTANFSKLYVHALKETSPPPESLKQDIRGSWTKYDQTTDPRRARVLSSSLQGHGTGWCTAGDSTAATHLAGGDFYVYYTRDEDGKETIPRVAIRMQQGKVAEVRGINPGQELELELAETTLERLQDLPGGEQYSVMAADMKQLTALEKQLTADSYAVLSRDDVKFLYEIDHQVQGFGYDKDPRIGEIRQLRGDQDHHVLRELAVEHLREGFEASYAGYMTVAQQISKMRRGIDAVPVLGKQELEELFESKMKLWERNGVLDTVADRIIENGELHTPVITPEVVATPAEIMQLAKTFGEGQPHETYLYEELYSKYSAAELSDTGEVQISLIPSKYDRELSRQNVEQQRASLRNRQTAQPDLKLRVPSVLEAVTYWHTLRYSGDTLADKGAFEKTIIRHFDLEPKSGGDWLGVPYSFVGDDGQPALSGSGAVLGSSSRLALG